MFDIEPRNNINMCDYDIFHDDGDKTSTDNCNNKQEFTPVKVDPNKLK